MKRHAARARDGGRVAGRHCSPPTPAFAQKSGGILKISFFDSPASMSIHEEATGRRHCGR